MRLFQRARKAPASLWFRGSIAAPAESFGKLRSRGIEVRELAPPEGCRWALSLSHPDWGMALLSAPREPALPCPMLLEMQWGLDDLERQGLREAGHELRLLADSHRKHVLRDRKLLLRWGRLILGDEGVGLADATSQLLWSVARLDDELAHDADLDIGSIFCLHAVAGEHGGGCEWLHSHGLGEIGGFDFDVLRPSESVMAVAEDLSRAMAFAIVEGTLTESHDRFPLVWPGEDIRMVPAAEFQARAPEPERRLRDPEHHDGRRSVACEPAGLFSRLLRHPVRASQFLSGPLPENSVFSFSSEASQLMAERARLTLGVLGALCEELAGLELPTLLKLGYGTTTGGTEHLWFELNELGDGKADLTLVNEPHGVPHLREGQRGWHDLGRLTDWVMLTPAGRISPRDASPARLLRRDREKFERMLKQSRG